MACREIDGISYILNEVSLECYTDQYNKYTYGFLFPLLFVWAFGIPGFMLYNLKSIADKNIQRNNYLQKI